MEVNKCPWCLGDPLYEHYHDTQWGVPVYDDDILFEYLILETMQAWIELDYNFKKARKLQEGVRPI